MFLVYNSPCAKISGVCITILPGACCKTCHHIASFPATYISNIIGPTGSCSPSSRAACIIGRICCRTLFLHWDLRKAGSISYYLVYELETYSLVCSILSLELRQQIDLEQVTLWAPSPSSKTGRRHLPIRWGDWESANHHHAQTGGKRQKIKMEQTLQKDVSGAGRKIKGKM